jgi:PAS domain S-box-containing protein
MKTIKSKLLLVYLLFTCITLSASFYCYTIYRAREYNAEIKDLIHVISSEILMLNKLEMQFVAYDSKNNVFFEGAGSSYVEKHQKIVADIHAKIKTLENEHIANDKITQRLRQLKIQLIHYNNDYQRFVAKVKERGFRDLGIEGEMRECIHKIENSYKNAGDESLLLTIRRNEKDYFLRKDTTYIDRHHKNVMLFRDQIKQDKQLTIAEKKLYVNWLDNYFVLFTKWRVIDNEIGIDQGIGMTAKMKMHNNQFEEMIQSINEESDRSGAVLSTNNKAILLTAICVSVILSILLSILFSHIFTRPIKELSEYIDLIVKNNFSVPTKNLKTDSNDEIRDLFDNVNWMVNRVGVYICEIKKNEMIIEESARKFRSMIENSNDAIALMDKEGKIIYASSSTVKVIGYTSAEMEGRYVFEEIHPEDKSNLLEHLKEVMLYPETNVYVEIRKKHKDGGYRWLECHSCNMLQDPSVEAIITNYRDITSRKVSEFKIDHQYKELQKVNAELDGFVYSASHDLKAPLLSILGITTIAKHDSNEDISIFYFNMIETNIAKLLHVIKDIINFSRNTHLEVERELVDFNQIIQESIQSLSYLENKGKVDFNICIEEGVAFYSDKARLGMIFSNMISNAISYHNYDQARPVISISVGEIPAGQIEIIVSDNGQGISPEYHSRIFDMFYRASTDSKGSGLGLYIVKNIVEKMQGTIELTSIPGIGTQFKMVFDAFLPVKITEVRSSLMKMHA